MIRIAKLTDYGIVLMTSFADRGQTIHQASHGSAYNARELAAHARLPLPTVGKLLKTLSHAGLLVSFRGKKGGFTLSRPPEKITVADIIAALEGPISVTECSTPGLCEQERGCPMRANWQLINRAIRDALDGLTLAEIARPLPATRLFPLSGRRIAEPSLNLIARSAP